MNKQRLLRIARAVYVIGLVVLIVHTVADRWSGIKDAVSDARPGLVVLALALSFLLPVVTSVYWRTALRLLGSDVALPRVLLSTGRSIAARYVPGSIWYTVGRIALLRREGARSGALAVIGVLEIIMSLGVALTVGASLLAVTGVLPGGMGWIVPGVAVLIALSSPPVVTGLVRRLPGHGDDRTTLNWAAYGTLVGIMVLFWLCSAAVFVTYLRAYPLGDSFGMVTIAGAFLLSWGIGFVAFIAPQGIGVFEVSVASILVTQGVAEMAILIAAYRVVILIRDGIIAVSSEAVASRHPAPSSEAG